MKTIINTIIPTLLALILMSQSSSAQIKIQKDKQNIISSRIEGKWKTDEALNDRLGFTKSSSETITFRSDERALKQISKKNSQLHAMNITYMAGFMNLDGTDLPFIIQEHNGVPTIVCFIEYGGIQAPVKLTTVLAVAEKTQNDLLFIKEEGKKNYRSHSRVVDIKSPKPSIQKTKSNKISKRLEGTWTIDNIITKRLISTQQKEIITFKSDESVKDQIPNKYKKILANKKVYMVGSMSFTTKQYPFLLVQIKGNPYVIYFRSNNNGVINDAESFNIMLVDAKDKKNDILFCGGDFNNRAFKAYFRVPTTSK